MSNQYLKLNCRGQVIEIPEYEIEIFKLKDNFLSNLLSFDPNDINKEIYIWEDKNVVLSIIDSIRLNKTIIHKDVNEDYYYGLCNKWNVLLQKKDIVPDVHPDLKDRIKSLNHFYQTIFNSDGVKQCNNCHSGFKENENHSQACKTHRWAKIIDGIYECCNSSEPCKIGYHICPTNFLEKRIIFLKIISNLFNFPESLD